MNELDELLGPTASSPSTTKPAAPQVSAATSSAAPAPASRPSAPTPAPSAAGEVMPPEPETLCRTCSEAVIVEMDNGRGLIFCPQLMRDTDGGRVTKCNRHQTAEAVPA